ncbi:MAG: sugar O-acetyltransferase [bacterium F082]|nr:MAG: sugar O-acetyltransferase [bacterium F082]KWW30003.1 MAG: sugar O-acetyltransferase [bacterium P201]
MVFSSNIFLLYFMPVFFLVYFLMPRKTRNYVLLLGSLVFYAWGAPEFIIQLVLSIIANFFIVRWMCKTEKPVAKKWLCALSVFISLGLLLFYKYGNFTMENLNALLGITGHAPLSWRRIMLPIGISFFTFQSLTYTLDTYRGVNKPLEKLSDYMLYITMFPQLIAGPIVRYCDVADQIRQRESTLVDRMQGFYRFVIGLSKKILIADVIGLRVDAILGAASQNTAQLSEIASRIATLDTGTAWLVALAYTFQIYFDFAGYSDMAIGLGRIMGFKFPENFDNPYTSRSITEFWRRWHKTLGAFIMNYLYIPLGGNRKGTGRMYLNLWLCFLLSGLWHGAAWNFVVWGALHGVFICADKLFLGKVMKKIGTVPSVILTFLTVCIIWMFFRIEDIGLALIFVTRMFAFDFNGFVFPGNAHVYTTLVVAALFSFITLTGWGKRLEQKTFYTDFSERQHIWVWIAAALLFIFCVAALNATSFSPFIYFRF